jgi:hypothetical protein
MASLLALTTAVPPSPNSTWPTKRTGPGAFNRANYEAFPLSLVAPRLSMEEEGCRSPGALAGKEGDGSQPRAGNG